MEELIRNWYTLNNNHPLDDARFFDIVKDSIQDNIEMEVFQRAVENVNPAVTEEELSDIYSKYELLREFAIYCNV